MPKKHTASVLGVITARGGSKSIYKKSIAPCAGHPLMFYTIMAAKASTTITRLVISTDDEEMADVCRNYGVEVLGLLPTDLLRHDIAHFTHVLGQLDVEGYVPDAVVHLRPTTPLKKTADIDQGVMLLLENEDAESVRSVCAPAHTPFKMYRMHEGEPYLEPLLKKEFPEVFLQFVEPFNMPRQILPQVLRHSGYVDVVRPSVVRLGTMSGTRILPLYMEEWRDVDIDTPRDLEYASWLIEKLRSEGKHPWE